MYKMFDKYVEGLYYHYVSSNWISNVKKRLIAQDIAILENLMFGRTREVSLCN